MPVEVIMPKVDMDMDRGVISAWRVAEGETVAKGDPLFDIETDKAAMEVEAPSAGVLRFVTARDGDEVAIGAPVAWIYGADETADAPPASAPKTDDAARDTAPPPAAAAPAPQADAAPAPGARRRATPAARKLAETHGLDLAALTGSGPRGRIQRADVAESIAAAPEPAPAALRAEAPGLAPEPRPADQSGPLSVLRSGRGEARPAVLIHGFAADAAAWTAVERRIARTRPVYRIELPSHGRSPLRRVAGFAELVAETRRAFDALDLDGVHLVGHSLGGAVALGLADTRPRRIGALTLIAPAGLGPEIDGDALHGVARAGRAESLGPWLQKMTGAPDALGWSFVQAAALARSDPALRAMQREMAETLFPDGVQAFSVAAALERVEAPTRIVWGRRDRIIPWRHALAAPGRVSLNLFPDLGHMPHVEAPEQIVALLDDLA